MCVGKMMRTRGNRENDLTALDKLIDDVRAGTLWEEREVI
jgi:hypothetical protein